MQVQASQFQHSLRPLFGPPRQIAHRLSQPGRVVRGEGLGEPDMGDGVGLENITLCVGNDDAVGGAAQDRIQAGILGLHLGGALSDQLLQVLAVLLQFPLRPLALGDVAEYL